MTGGFFGLLELFHQFISTIPFRSERGKIFLSQAHLYTIFLNESLIAAKGTVFLSAAPLHTVFLGEEIL